MIHKKKVLLFAALLSATLVLAGQGFCEPGLKDVKGHWAEEHICLMIDRNLLAGYPDNTFKPNKQITRKEFMAILARANQLENAVEPPYFEDVIETDWAYPYIQALAQDRIIHPEDYEGKLNPNGSISRVEIAVMLVRAAGLEKECNKTSTLTTFSDIPEWARGYVTTALNHGLITGYPSGAFGPNNSATRAEAGLMVLRLLDPKTRPAVWEERYTFAGNTLKVVRINFNRDDIEIKPALAGKIKDTAYLADIAKQSKAIAAINGTYFSAYTNNGGDFGEPYHTLLVDGQWIHFNFSGTTMGITRDKQILMAPIRMWAQGATNGDWGNWTAWSMNHTAPNIIGIFTKYRGETTNMADGITFTVKQGKIVSKGGPDVPIPDDGYVVFVSNSKINKWTNGMFPVGGYLKYRVRFYTRDDKPYPWESDWQNVHHAIGCGPRLVTSGNVTVNPQSEGFTEAKQTTMSANRSGVGVTQDNIVMFVTCTSLTPEGFGEAMADLGAYNAMQLDGGASSCLYYDGTYLTSPGRKINNGLVVIEKPQK